MGGLLDYFGLSSILGGGKQPPTSGKRPPQAFPPSAVMRTMGLGMLPPARFTRRPAAQEVPPYAVMRTMGLQMVPPSAPKLQVFESPKAPREAPLNVPPPAHVRANSSVARQQATGARKPDPFSLDDFDLGPHEAYRKLIVGAAQRSGLSPQQIAETIEKETGGTWDFNAVNGRHKGAMQFDGETWLGEAKRKGSYLHDLASKRGHLDRTGQVLPKYEQELLELRGDPETAIYEGADYGKFNRAHLKDLLPDASPLTEARYGYGAHHDGLSGAQDLLLHRRKASVGMLVRNFGAEKARAALKAHNGNANAAYEDLDTQFLNSFDPSLFTHEGQARARAAKLQQQRPRR